MKNSAVILLVGIGIFLSAFTVVAQEYALSIASQGVVQTVNVRAGEKVKKGQVLLTLDRRVYQARLDEAVAGLRSMKLDFDEQKKELARAEELYDRTVTSDRDLSLAKIAFANAESQLKKAQREEAQARYDFEHSRLLAPFTGKIKFVHAFPGMVVVNQMKATVLMTMEK